MEEEKKKNKAFDDIKTVLDSVLTNLEKNITPLLKANIKSSSPLRDIGQSNTSPLALSPSFNSFLS